MKIPQSVAVAGAGLSGLAVANALLDAGFQGTMRIFDAKPTFTNDRTWCWWDVPDVPFRELASHRWHAWTVGSAAHHVRAASDAHPYVMLPGIVYYEAMQRKLRHAVQWHLGEPVLCIEERDEGAIISTQQAGYGVDLVIDARGALPMQPRLVQHFFGEHIVSPRPVFDPQAVTLMDFRPSRDGIAFTYLLPFSSTEALVEDTVIGTNVDFDARARSVGSYVRERFQISSWKTLRCEQGAIPMDARAVDVQASPHVLRAGISAAATRSASGYTYVRAHRHAAALAHSVMYGKPLPQAGKLRYRLLDAVILKTLASGWLNGETFFRTFFDAAPTDAAVRFMSDASTLEDDCKIIYSLAKRLPSMSRRFGMQAASPIALAQRG